MKRVGHNRKQDPYPLKTVLGAGSFGKVFLSEIRGQKVAVKEISVQGMPSFLFQSLQNQIKILRQIHHPNIVRMIDDFFEAGFAYLVMEYCEQDLSQFLKSRAGKVSEQEALHILKQILRGFQELTESAIIHRDLKPANILVTKKGQFKLADFGFAKIVNQYGNNMLSSIVGTPLYMAPQILERKNYTTKCDIWSIGQIFYELMVGKLPWQGQSEETLLYAIKTKPLRCPKNISSWSQNLLGKMLIVDQTLRIGWKELFKFVFSNQSEGRERSLSKGSRHNRNLSKNVGNEQFQPGLQHNIEVLTSEKAAKLLQIEIKRFSQNNLLAVLKMAHPNKLDQSDKKQFHQILASFNPDFQKAIKAMYQFDRQQH